MPSCIKSIALSPSALCLDSVHSGESGGRVDAIYICIQIVLLSVHCSVPRILLSVMPSAKPCRIILGRSAHQLMVGDDPVRGEVDGRQTAGPEAAGRRLQLLPIAGVLCSQIGRAG